MGIDLVGANGRKALRAHCLWRSFLVWAPIACLCMLDSWLDIYHPDMVLLSWALWWLAVAILMGYFALALRFPNRSFHDYLSGVYLVPR